MNTTQRATIWRGAIRSLCVWASVFVCEAWAASPAAARKWPFVPLVRPALPQAESGAAIENEIDLFLARTLAARGLKGSPPADRATLLRRVSFDLTGLPPTPEAMREFLADDGPDAYPRLVDRLLAAPQFGERWAQHWLDVVRFTESNGYKTDQIRPEAYRYRDYVIRAFNADLPYDRFLAQQLAGDELEPENPEAVVAAGFNRLYPEETNASNFRQLRQDILDDLTDVAGAAILGLTLSCARCHDHKFDPLLQTDYYRLQAFFAPLVARDNVPLAAGAERRRYDAQLAAWEQATAAIRQEMDRLCQAPRQAIRGELLVTFDADTQAALDTPPERRTMMQQQLAALTNYSMQFRLGRAYRRLEGAARDAYDTLEKQLESFAALKPAPLPLAMSVSDCAGPPTPTFVLATGNYRQPEAEVQPGFPEFLDAAPPTITAPPLRPASSGRRSALARWLTRPDHPLTSRVFVNRVWQRLLGRGIVASPNDFGAMGDPATHPELLDWLAADFVSLGWRLKPLVRQIVLSAAYRQTSHVRADDPNQARALALDPRNELYWRAARRRLEGEAIRDVILHVAGELNPRMHGPSARPELPQSLMESRYSWDPDARVEDRQRRSIYVLTRRNLRHPLLAAFDPPDGISSCGQRNETTTAPQSLVLLNGEFSWAQAKTWAEDLAARHPPSAPGAADGAEWNALARDAYRHLFSREPAAAEVAAAVQFLKSQHRLLTQAGAPALPSGPAADAARRAAIVDFCHALFNASELMYID